MKKRTLRKSISRFIKIHVLCARSAFIEKHAMSAMKDSFGDLSEFCRWSILVESNEIFLFSREIGTRRATSHWHRSIDRSRRPNLRRSRRVDEKQRQKSNWNRRTSKRSVGRAIEPNLSVCSNADLRTQSDGSVATIDTRRSVEFGSFPRPDTCDDVRRSIFSLNSNLGSVCSFSLLCLLVFNLFLYIKLNKIDRMTAELVDSYPTWFQDLPFVRDNIFAVPVDRKTLSSSGIRRTPTDGQLYSVDRNISTKNKWKFYEKLWLRHTTL